MVKRHKGLVPKVSSIVQFEMHVYADDFKEYLDSLPKDERGKVVFIFTKKNNTVLAGGTHFVNPIDNEGNLIPIRGYDERQRKITGPTNFKTAG